MRKSRRTLLDSFRDAFRGIRHCLRAERNMRVHLAATVAVILLAVCLRVSRGELACLLLAIGMVTAAEAMNTAVERLCDFVEEKHNPRIGIIKDMAAGGVLLAAIFAAAMGATIFLPPVFEWISVLQRYI